MIWDSIKKREEISEENFQNVENLPKDTSKNDISYFLIQNIMNYEEYTQNVQFLKIMRYRGPSRDV